jgi:multiple sugar transport system substrate-binding protein
MKLRSKITAASIVGVATVAASLTSVGTGSAQAAPHTSDTAKVTTLKLDDDKAFFTPGYKAMSKLLTAQLHIALQINVFANDESAFVTTILNGKAAHEQPALFTWHTGGQMQQVVSADEASNTSTIWKQDIANGTLPAALEKYYTYNGSQYCVPETLDYWGMYYNTAIFSKYKLTVPSTWSELMSDAAVLKAHGQTPFYEADSTWSFIWFQILLGQEDPTAYSQLVNGKIPWTAPPVVHAMQMWESLLEDGYMSNPTTTEQQQVPLSDGSVAMVPSGTWLNSSFPALKFKTYGFFLIPNVNPSLSKTVTFFETSPLCASPGLPTSASAQAVLSWWNTTPPQTVWSKTEQDISENPNVPAPVPGFASINSDIKAGTLEVLERYYEAVPATVLTESLNDFSAFEVNPKSYMTQLAAIEKVAKTAYTTGG